MRSGNAAAAWAEARDTFLPVNNCLRAVLMAYDVLGQIAPLARADATATEAWDLAQDQHPRDRNPARGALVCFPNWGAGKSGHIAIGLGGDRVRSTGIDSTAYFTGSIAQVAAACGNPYAGWAGDFAGTRIDFTSSTGGGTTPFNNMKEIDMKFGLIKGDGETTVYAVRLIDSAIRALGPAEYAAFLSAGYTLRQVAQAEMNQLKKDSGAKWFASKKDADGNFVPLNLG